MSGEKSAAEPCAGCGGPILNPGHGRRYCEVCNPPLKGRRPDPRRCRNRVPGPEGPWMACGEPVEERGLCRSCAARLSALGAMLSPGGRGGRTS